MQDLYKELGDLIRDRRKALGMSQETLARNVGLSRTSITNIECGRQHVALHLLYDLASFLRTEPSALLPSNASVRSKKTLKLDEKHLSSDIAQSLEGFYDRITSEEIRPNRRSHAPDKKS